MWYIVLILNTTIKAYLCKNYIISLLLEFQKKN